MSKLKSPSPYTELFEFILHNHPTPAEVIVYSASNLSRIRAGLSRAKIDYEQVCKFVGDKAITKDKQFSYKTSDLNNKVLISLVDIPTPSFEIVK
jgi:hypothetical protein